MNLFNQFLTIFWALRHPILTAIIIIIIIVIIIIIIIIIIISFDYIYIYYAGTQKWVTQMPPLYNTYEAETLCSKFCKDKQNRTFETDLIEVWLI